MKKNTCRDLDTAPIQKNIIFSHIQSLVIVLLLSLLAKGPNESKVVCSENSFGTRGHAFRGGNVNKMSTGMNWQRHKGRKSIGLLEKYRHVRTTLALRRLMQTFKNSPCALSRKAINWPNLISIFLHSFIRIIVSALVNFRRPATEDIFHFMY